MTWWWFAIIFWSVGWIGLNAIVLASAKAAEIQERTKLMRGLQVEESKVIIRTAAAVRRERELMIGSGELNAYDAAVWLDAIEKFEEQSA